MNFSSSDALQEFNIPRHMPPTWSAQTPFCTESDLEAHEPPDLWRCLIEQADVCLEHAHLAEKGLRFSAACGLILTAQELLRRSLSVECSTTAHLTLERAVIERMDASRSDLDRLLDLAVQVRLFAA